MIVSAITTITANLFRCPQHHAHDQRDRRHAHAFRDRARHQKCCCRHRSRPRAESFFDQRIRREKFSAKISRQQQEHDQHAPDQISKHELQKRHVPAVRNRRRPDDRQRGRFRRHDRKRQRPPRRRSPAQKIILRVLRPAPEINAQRRHAQQVRNHNPQINRMYSHRARLYGRIAVVRAAEIGATAGGEADWNSKISGELNGNVWVELESKSAPSKN